ncbi:DUF6843 domain-containing protein [Neobacillus sp. NRS-1170]|uniref:DUF6843 domain-containing protein n=1 Tax=Neobacillus sp. NRS-1170 TaxID=3233898 RepID=UPI003D286790
MEVVSSGDNPEDNNELYLIPWSFEGALIAFYDALNKPILVTEGKYSVVLLHY